MPQYPQNFSCAEKKWNIEKKNKFLAAVRTNLVHNTDSCFNISINKSYVWLNLKNMFQKNFRKMCLDSFYLDTKVSGFSSRVFLNRHFKKVFIQILENINRDSHSVAKLQSVVTELSFFDADTVIQW